MKLSICMLLPFNYGPDMVIVPQVGICSYLSNFGHEITWVIPCKDVKKLQQILAGNIYIYTIPYRKYINETNPLTKILNRIPYMFRTIWSIHKIMAERKCNMVVARNNAFDGLLAIYIKKRYKCPFVFALDNPLEQEWEEEYKIEQGKSTILYYLIAKTHRFLKTYIINNADLILPISKWLAMHLVKQGVSETKMMPLPEGVDDRVFFMRDGKDVRKKYGLDGSNVIIYVGTMTKARQLSILIKAFSKVKKVNINNGETKLLMVGKGSDKDNIERLADELGVKNSIIFTGQVPQSEIPKFIAAADIGVSMVPPFPFYKLSSPIKMFEYMAMGKPVIANKEIPEHKEILEESEGGILVPFEDDALANAIIELLNKPEEASDMGKNGRKWILKNRTYSFMAHQLEGRLCELWRTQEGK